MITNESDQLAAPNPYSAVWEHSVQSYFVVPRLSGDSEVVPGGRRGLCLQPAWQITGTRQLNHRHAVDMFV